MPRPIKSTLRRHSVKSGKTKTGLTASGIKLARKTGKRELSGKVKGYHSSATRAKSTLVYGMQGHKGKKYSKIRVRKELSYYFLKDMAKLESLVVKHGEEKFLRMWLDGKVSSRLISKPEEVANLIIKKRFGLGQRVAKLGAKDIMIENVSHSWIVEAVFERLTGKKYNTLKPGTMGRFTEGLTINHYKNGKAVLTYRGNSFNDKKAFSSCPLVCENPSIMWAIPTLYVTNSEVLSNILNNSLSE